MSQARTSFSLSFGDIDFVLFGLDDLAVWDVLGEFLSVFFVGKTRPDPIFGSGSDDEEFEFLQVGTHALSYHTGLEITVFEKMLMHWPVVGSIRYQARVVISQTYVPIPI